MCSSAGDPITALSKSLGLKQLFDGPKMPKSVDVPVLPEAPHSPLGNVVASVKEIDERRRRALTGKSKTTTFLTGARGDTSDPNVSVKTLLGD